MTLGDKAVWLSIGVFIGSAWIMVTTLTALQCYDSLKYRAAFEVLTTSKHDKKE